MAKQMLDIKTSKGMSKGQSNEHLRVRTKDSLEHALRVGNYDPTRVHLNFEVTRGGIISAVNQKQSIPRRMKYNLTHRGIRDPNEGLETPRTRTVVNMLLGGSREQMRRLAFGDQQLKEGDNVDNSHLVRKPEIERWAQDMYKFVGDKFGEENIVAFIVHLDEKNPHVHCTLLPINEKNEFKYKEIFHGQNKFTLSRFYMQLHDELSVINKKYALDRGSAIAETGARHRTTEEYLRMLDEQRNTLEDEAKTLQGDITSYKSTKKALEDDIKKANTRVKGLTTMIVNLEAEKAKVISELEEIKASGERNTREAEERQKMLEEKLSEIERKIQDKEQKLEKANELLGNLGEHHKNLRDEYDRLQMEVAKVAPVANEKALREVHSVLSEMLIDDIKEQFSHISDIAPNVLDYFDDTLMMDMAEHGKGIVSVAAALMIGYIDQATEFAKTSGGGGSPGSDFSKKDAEDDRQWARRCFWEARKMVTGNGKKKAMGR